MLMQTTATHSSGVPTGSQTHDFLIVNLTLCHFATFTFHSTLCPEKKHPRHFRL